MKGIKQSTWLSGLLLVLCFVYYGNTLFNGFALDDAIVITDNKFTQKGFTGIGDIFTHDSFTGFFGEEKTLVAGGRYRPLSIALFAIEHQIWGSSPFIGHIGNILFFALTCMLLFAIFRKLFEKFDGNGIFSLSFIASFLFLIHPIHTEVVANIKGLDEILSLLCSLLAWWFVIGWTEKKKPLDKALYLFLAAAALFLGLLSKENAITFLAIIPLSLWCFGKLTARNIVVILLPLLAATALFLKVRFNVLGYGASGGTISELMNNPFVDATLSQKYATIVYTLGLYVKLLLFPHPLTYDYYPYHITLVDWANGWVLLSLLVYLSLAALCVWLLLKKHLVGFGLLVFFASLSIVSNIFFPIGTFMNERFMFMPSLGFSLILAWLLVKELPKILNSTVYRKVMMAVLIILLIATGYKTIDRNRAWMDDLTLFRTDVKVSFNSAKSTCSAGGKIYEAAKEEKDSTKRDALLQESLYYLHRSVAIYPEYSDALLLLGNALFEVKKYDSTVFYYKRILNKAPFFDKVYENMPIVLNKFESVDYKIEVYNFMYAKNPNNYTVCYQLGTLWGRYKGDLAAALRYLERAVALNPRGLEALKDLGVAYGMSGKFKESLAILQRAESVAPTDEQVLGNLVITHQNLGNVDLANLYIQKAQAAKKK